MVRPVPETPARHGPGAGRPLGRRLLPAWLPIGAGRLLVPVLQPLLAIAISLALGVVIIVAIGERVGPSYGSFLLGSFTSPVNFGNMLATATPLILTGLAVAVSFQAGAFNIGAEGQLYLGAFWAAWAGFTFIHLPGLVLVPLCLLVGACAGAAWGFLPGWMKASLGINEVVSTLLLNYVAMLVTEYLVNNPFKDPRAGAPVTVPLAPQANLGHVLPPSSAHDGILIALAIVVLVALVLGRTVWGQSLRFVGMNPRFAEYEGIPVRRTLITAMMFSGAIAGVAGAVQVLGINHRFIQGFSPDFGFTGITVALLGRVNPWGTAVAAVFYAILTNGAAIMQQQTTVPYPLVSVLQGILVLFVTAEGLLAWTRRRRPSLNRALAAPREVTPDGLG